MIGKQIRLDQSTESKITEIVNELLSYIEKQSKRGELSPDYYYDILLFLSEALPYTENQSFWINLGYGLCKEFKQSLEESGINQWTAMFRGLGYQCFAVSNFCRQANILNDFSHSINHLLFIATDNKIEQIKNSETYDFNYDMISGISGVLYYLLDCDYNQDEELIILRCINYLLEVTKDAEYCGETVIKFHVLRENQNKYFDQEDFKNGSINFGLAHGMLGPLISLAKAYAKGFNVDGLRDGIEKVFHLYETFQSLNEENVPVWPGKITVEEYVEGICRPEHLHVTSSWCYGNIGIMRGLQKVCGYMKWNGTGQTYVEAMKRFCTQELDHFNLKSPSLCHGFSSLVAIQTCTFYDCRESKLLSHLERNVRQIIAGYQESNKHKVNLVDIINRTNQTEGYLSDLSLLTGSVGIAISLLSLKGKIATGKLLMID